MCKFLRPKVKLSLTYTGAASVQVTASATPKNLKDIAEEPLNCRGKSVGLHIVESLIRP